MLYRSPLLIHLLESIMDSIPSQHYYMPFQNKSYLTIAIGPMVLFSPIQNSEIFIRTSFISIFLIKLIHSSSTNKTYTIMSKLGIVNMRLKRNGTTVRYWRNNSGVDIDWLDKNIKINNNYKKTMAV